MPNYIMIHVADAKPDKDAEFNFWYDTVHLPDICALPGVKSGRRLEAEPNLTSVAPTRYANIYELEADYPDTVVREFHRRFADGEMRISAALEEESANIFFYRPI